MDQGREKSRRTHSLLFAVLLTLATGLVMVCGCNGGGGGSGSASSGNPSPPPPGAEGPGGDCPNQTLPLGTGKNIVIDSECHVKEAGIYKYGNISIIDNGKLIFDNDTSASYRVDFWTSSIIIEAGGSMIAGSPTTPWGSNMGTLTIHLWGSQPETKGGHVDPVLCRTKETADIGPCGVPHKTFFETNNLDTLYPPKACTSSDLPGPVTDCFYKYNPLPGDDLATKDGYFGKKEIALSFNGTLELYGWKGATYDASVDANPADTGDSWVRLNNCAGKSCTSVKGTELDLSHKVNWQADDWVVITSTDYLMSHSEVRQIDHVSADNLKVFLKTGLDNLHVAKVYTLPAGDPTGLGQVDTRAAVGLLTRSIRIVSGGQKLLDEFPDPPSYPADKEGYYFGGHTVYRQGFKALHLQGVEFYQLGQGGRIAHYPVHFHLARKVPAGTFVKDCSVWESMTRLFVIHNTSGVTLQRNVGYRSIGHGYYLEDATETNNHLYANLGVSAVAGAYEALNPRRIPGILSAPNYPVVPNTTTPRDPDVPYHSDVNQPTIFWITNGWNDFRYNMAVGADTCGTCYWAVPAFNSTAGRYMYWTGYASEQKDFGHAATTPLMSFIGNTCSAAANSFNVVGNEGSCNGVSRDQIGEKGDGTDHPTVLQPVKNFFIPKKYYAPDKLPINQVTDESANYYPNLDQGGGRFPTYCPNGESADCSTVGRCGTGQTANCAVTVLDHFTTSFNFAQANFAALWLRPQWYLAIDSAITDPQFGGLTFVTGGSWTYSDITPGTWQLAMRDVFIGSTQPQNPADTSFNKYAENDGPFNAESKLACVDTDANYCLSKNDGIDMQLVDYAVGQRLYNIYDGPNYQDSSSYLDITPTTPVPNCQPGTDTTEHKCAGSAVPYGRVNGIRRDGSNCYLPNAAIAWKQPNGFYYPPAFHSKNLSFKNVDIRHFVFEPLFKNGHQYDGDATVAQYCTYKSDMWSSFSDVDRQTELTDDDGSLTGLRSGSVEPFEPTISVNEDPFFTAPEETAQCASDKTGLVPPGTAKTSPYQYVTTVVYPDCGNSLNQTASCGEAWSVPCTNSFCYGVPLYRQLLTPSEYQTWKTSDARPSIRMAGQANTQRSNLTVNHGDYYIDTTVPLATQKAASALVNAFQNGKRYHVFLIYAPPSTQQTYRLFVGKDFDMNTLKAEQANLSTGAVPFTPLPKYPWPPATLNSDGFLTVTIDDSFPDYVSNYNKARVNLCQPPTFCAPDKTGTCTSAITNDPNSPLNYLYLEYGPGGPDILDRICQENSPDVDCPDGGCYGFGFTLPSNFETGAASATIPNPSCVTLANNPTLATPLTPADSAIAGSCFYNAAPPSGLFCTTPNPP
jgi:cell migration-inducing and hyaluronan-binding protein